MIEDKNLDDRKSWRLVINAPIEAIWDLVVATGEVMPHLFGAVCEAPDGLAAGRAFRMTSKNGKVVTAVGKVLELSPPRRFVHTIHFPQNAGEVPGRTTYELQPVSDGTELTLTAEAVAGSKTAKMGQAGPFIAGNIKKLAETGRPTALGAVITTLSPVMTRFAPRNARSENWPVGRIHA